MLMLYLIFCFAIAFVAHQKGKGPIGFFLISVFLTPLVAMIILAVVIANEKKAVL